MPGENGHALAPLTGADALASVRERLGCPLEQALEFPRFVCLDPTSECNARCIMCGVDRNKVKGRRMSDALFAKIVAELAGRADHVQRVGLFVICEPLTDPNLEAKIAALKGIGIRSTHISSNGALLWPERARGLLAAGLDRIYISIDSLIPERYESIRRGLRFQDVYDNTRQLIRLRDAIRPETVIRVQMILQETNLDEADSFLAHWRDKVGPGDQVVVTKVFNWGKVTDAMQFQGRQEANRIPCIAPWSTLEVMADGQAPLCCVDVDVAGKLGDLNEQSIAEIWHGRQIERIRRMHLAGQRCRIPLCDGCSVWPEKKHLSGSEGVGGEGAKTDGQAPPPAAGA